MARKKSTRLAAKAFRERVDEVAAFLDEVEDAPLSDKHISWAYDFAIIQVYREFERLMLEALVAAINNDTKTISDTVGMTFPKHLTDEVCQYLIVGQGYFDFRGRDGLIRVVCKFVPKTHYLVKNLKKPAYKTPLERLAALRNFAAHGSAPARLAAKSAVGAKRFSSSGAWLKVGVRYDAVIDPLLQLSKDIAGSAPR